MIAAIDLRARVTIVAVAVAHGSVVWSASRGSVVVDAVAAAAVVVLTHSTAIDWPRRLVKGSVIDV